MVDLAEALPERLRAGNEAATLVIRQGAGHLGVDADLLLQEQETAVAYDRRFYDQRRGRTLNKQARYNIVFGEEDIPASADFRQCTVKGFAGLPHLAALRAGLSKFGPKASELLAEGNLYYDSGCGIGFHGDAERKTVICLSLGKASVLRYQWRLPGSSAHTLPPVSISVGHGDIYIMSEKATGFDWKMRSKVRVVHAAGAPKYIDR